MMINPLMKISLSEENKQPEKALSASSGFGSILALLSSPAGQSPDLHMNNRNETAGENNEFLLQELFSIIQQQEPVFENGKPVTEDGSLIVNKTTLSPEEWMDLPLKDALLHFFNGNEQKLNELLKETALPKGKASSAESLFFLQNQLEKLEKSIQLKVPDPSSAQMLHAIKQLTHAAKQSDSPAAASPIADELFQTLEKIEGMLRTLQSEKREIKIPVSKVEYGAAIAFAASTISNKVQMQQSDPADIAEKPEASAVSIQQLQTESGLAKWNAPLEIKASQPAESLIKQFAEVMDKAKFGKTNGTEKLLIRLQPEHLGTLRIELIQKSGVLAARVMTSTNLAKDMMDSQIQQLRQALTNQNIQIDKIEIILTQSDQRTDRETDSSSKQHPGSDHKQNSESEEDDGEDKQDFHQIFMNIEV
ncbi:flagellar hook-length control protein FliK [Jeotgalibacillus sp. ET6]|uniref:flagellar hook-length control protein FliK n=1 Tax=Jeotgalibacillus sp. ET6 TaxID=3037260 RepID=UPI00241892A8|nr:flagellar hook-length control protein FliK [Jeotgalibacillus sp. ET6]MDG5470292.1 flagellar hook-length control protein FliK [Jeotgalibacillus sp. ET6]